MYKRVFSARRSCNATVCFATRRYCRVPSGRIVRGLSREARTETANNLCPSRYASDEGDRPGSERSPRRFYSKRLRRLPHTEKSPICRTLRDPELNTAWRTETTADATSSGLGGRRCARTVSRIVTDETSLVSDVRRRLERPAVNHNTLRTTPAFAGHVRFVSTTAVS